MFQMTVCSYNLENRIKNAGLSFARPVSGWAKFLASNRWGRFLHHNTHNCGTGLSHMPEPQAFGQNKRRFDPVGSPHILKGVLIWNLAHHFLAKEITNLERFIIEFASIFMALVNCSSPSPFLLNDPPAAQLGLVLANAMIGACEKPGLWQAAFELLKARGECQRLPLLLHVRQSYLNSAGK